MRFGPTLGMFAASQRRRNTKISRRSGMSYLIACERAFYIHTSAFYHVCRLTTQPFPVLIYSPAFLIPLPLRYRKGKGPSGTSSYFSYQEIQCIPRNSFLRRRFMNNFPDILGLYFWSGAIFCAPACPLIFLCFLQLSFLSAFLRLPCFLCFSGRRSCYSSSVSKAAAKKPMFEFESVPFLCLCCLLLPCVLCFIM